MVNSTSTAPVSPALARHLGLLHFAIGGSRAYREQDPPGGDTDSDAKRDWDFIGIVESRNDIVSIALHKTTQLNTLLGVVRMEYSGWQVGPGCGR